MFKGHNQGVNNYVDAPAYRAKTYPDQAWEQAVDLGMNCIQFTGGPEGNFWHVQLNENHPYGRTYNSDWAENLEAFLAKAASYGIKVVMHGMGSYYGTCLGFVPPMYNYNPNDPDGNPLKYISLTEAERLLDKLAGDNSLGHNFLTDPRVAWWSPINEARMNLDYVKDWTVNLLRMIKERGGKTSVCINDGAHPYSESFPYIIPIIGNYIDYLQAHCYNDACIHACTDGGSGVDMYPLAYAEFAHDFEAMMAGRGSFRKDQVMLTEFGCGHGTYSWHGGTDTLTKQQQADYIKAAFDAAKAYGIENVFYHETIWIRPWPEHMFGFGFVNYDGAITNQLAYNAYAAAMLQPVSLPFHDDFVDLTKWTPVKGTWTIK